MTGGVVSTTCMSCDEVAKFPRKSVAVHITVVVPTGNAAGALLESVGFGSIGSVGADEVPILTGVNCAVAFTVTGPGGVNEGGILSIKRIGDDVGVDTTGLPARSVAEETSAVVVPFPAPTV